MAQACVRMRMGAALRCTWFRVLSSSFPPPDPFLRHILHVPCLALPCPPSTPPPTFVLWDVASLHYKERFVALLVRLLSLVLVVALVHVLVLGF